MSKSSILGKVQEILPLIENTAKKSSGGWFWPTWVWQKNQKNI